MIEELTLSGFKSFRRQQTVHFTPGVNKISGRNASGKTTLLEAILFGLFGDVPRVKKKQMLVSLGGGDLSVTVKLRSPYTGQSITIHREGGLIRSGGYRTSTSWMKVEGEDAAIAREKEIQARLRELTGINRNAFLNIVYARQKEFIEILNPSKGRMDAILGLTTPTEIKEQLREAKKGLESRGRIGDKGAFQERAKNAAELVTVEEKRLQEAEAKLDELKMGLEEKKNLLNKAQAQVTFLLGFKDRLKVLDGLQDTINSLKGIEKGRQEDLEKAMEGLASSTPLNQLLRDKASAEATEAENQTAYTAFEADARARGGLISQLEHQIKEHAQLQEEGVAICPKCGQEIDQKLLEEDLRSWKKKLAEEKIHLGNVDQSMSLVRSATEGARNSQIEVNGKIKELEQKRQWIADIEKTLGTVDSQTAEVRSELKEGLKEISDEITTKLSLTFTSLPAALEEMGAEHLKAQSVASELQGEMRSRQVRIRDEENRKDLYETSLKNNQDALKETSVFLREILEYEQKLLALEAIQSRCVEYEQQLRERTLAQLEYQTYNYFKRLTDQQAYSSCRIDRERYTLEVFPLGGNRALPAWRVGGGHESLFALAERLALLKVMGFPYLLILDEPTDAVDSENIPQLLEYIIRSGREINQVLLVTHHGYGEEEEVNLITVEQSNGEPKVIQNPVST